MFGVNKKGEDVLSPQFRPGSKSPLREGDPKPGSALDFHMFVALEKQRLLTRERRLLLKKVLMQESQSGALAIPSEDLRTKAREMILHTKKHSLLQAEKERLSLINSPRQTIGTTLDIGFMNAIDRYSLEQDFKQIDSAYHARHPEVVQEALMLAYGQGQYEKEESFIEAQMKVMAQFLAEEAAQKDASVRATRASASAILSIKS